MCRFQKCSECERIRGEIQTGIGNGVETAEVLTEKNGHLAFVGRERRAYRKKKELEKDAHNEYLSLVIDGSDQS